MAGSDNLYRDSQSLRIKCHGVSRMDTNTRRALKVNELTEAGMILANIRLRECMYF